MTASLELILEFLEEGDRNRLAEMIRASDAKADSELGMESTVAINDDRSYSVMQRFSKIAEQGLAYYGRHEKDKGPQVVARLGQFWTAIGDYYAKLAEGEPAADSRTLPRFRQKSLACYFEAWNTFLDADYHEASARELVGRVPELLKIKTVWEHDQHPANFEYAKQFHG